MVLSFGLMPTRKLDVIHNSGHRMSIGAYCSSPISSIHNLSGIPPLDVRRLKLKFNQDLRLASYTPSLNFTPNLKNLHQLLHENKLEITSILPIKSPIDPTWINNIDTNIKLSILKKNSTNPPT